MVGCFGGDKYKSAYHAQAREKQDLQKEREDLSRQRDNAYAAFHQARDEAAQARADSAAQQDRAKKVWALAFWRLGCASMVCVCALL